MNMRVIVISMFVLAAGGAFAIEPGPDGASLDAVVLEACGFPAKELSFDVYQAVKSAYGDAFAKGVGREESSVRTASGYSVRIRPGRSTTVMLLTPQDREFRHDRAIFVDDGNDGTLDRLYLKKSRDPKYDLTAATMTLEEDGGGLQLAVSSTRSKIGIDFGADGLIRSIDARYNEPALNVLKHTTAERRRHDDGTGYFDMMSSIRWDRARWCTVYHFHLEATRNTRLQSAEFFYFDPSRCSDPYRCAEGITRGIKADYGYTDGRDYTVALSLKDQEREVWVSGIAPAVDENAAAGAIVTSNLDRGYRALKRDYTEGRLRDAALVAGLRHKMGKDFDEAASLHHVEGFVVDQAGAGAWEEFGSLVRTFRASRILDPVKLCIPESYCLAP